MNLLKFLKKEPVKVQAQFGEVNVNPTASMTLERAKGRLARVKLALVEMQYKGKQSLPKFKALQKELEILETQIKLHSLKEG